MFLFCVHEDSFQVSRFRSGKTDITQDVNAILLKYLTYECVNKVNVFKNFKQHFTKQHLQSNICYAPIVFLPRSFTRPSADYMFY